MSQKHQDLARTILASTSIHRASHTSSIMIGTQSWCSCSSRRIVYGKSVNCGSRNHVIRWYRSLAVIANVFVSSLSYHGSELSRRAWIQHQETAFIPLVLSCPGSAYAVPSGTDEGSPPQQNGAFQTRVFGMQEYTNALAASRDTNVSPAEAYDVIRQMIPDRRQARKTSLSPGVALDLGAGAGLSTQVLYEYGYLTIDAVDWSADAWDASVMQQPDSVRFYQLSDEEFFRRLESQMSLQQSSSMDFSDATISITVDPIKRYDCIVYNFAVNGDKAVSVARKYLKPTTGVLLAPCNDTRDYWYKQTYVLLDATGSILWKSDQEVGAWYIQFQPDVTSSTCTGIWCGGFNGFRK